MPSLPAPPSSTLASASFSSSRSSPPPPWTASAPAAPRMRSGPSPAVRRSAPGPPLMLARQRRGDGQLVVAAAQGDGQARQARRGAQRGGSVDPCAAHVRGYAGGVAHAVCVALGNDCHPIPVVALVTDDQRGVQDEGGRGASRRGRRREQRGRGERGDRRAAPAHLRLHSRPSRETRIRPLVALTRVPRHPSTMRQDAPGPFVHSVRPRVMKPRGARCTSSRRVVTIRRPHAACRPPASRATTSAPRRLSTTSAPDRRAEPPPGAPRTRTAQCEASRRAAPEDARGGA